MTHRLIFENPGPVFFIIFVAVFFSLRKSHTVTPAKLRQLSGYFGAVAVGAYIVVTGLNVFRGGLLWHDEANLLSISAAFLHGQPIYHALNAPAYYSLFYGPVVYIVYAPFLACLSNPLVAIRISLFVITTVELVLLFRIMRKLLSFGESLALLSVGSVMLLAYPDALLGFRGDIWILLFITTASLLVVQEPPKNWLIWAMIIGISLGLAIGVKVTVVPVTCLVIGILYRYSGTKTTVVAAISCIAISVGMFFLPHISLTNYFLWLLLSSHQHFLRSTCLNNVIAAALLLLPIAMGVFFLPREVGERLDWTLLFIGGVSLLVCVLTGSKDGAGPWHIWPMMPLMLLGAAYELRGHGRNDYAQTVKSTSQDTFDVRTSRRAVITFSLAIAGVCTSLYFAASDVRILHPLMATQWKKNELIAQRNLELLALMPHARNLSMGYGNNLNDYRTNLRFELPLAKQEYFFDENEVVEGIKEGKALPDAVLERILGCDDDWLIPHAETPFSSPRDGILPPTGGAYIFPDSLRKGFLRTHVLARQGDVYDLWECRADASKMVTASIY